MKKFYMTIVAMLCGAAAMAQNEISIADFSVKAGEVGEIPVGMNNTDGVTRIQVRFNVPSSVAPIKDADGFVTNPDDCIEVSLFADEFTVNDERLDLTKAKKATKNPRATTKTAFGFDVAGSWIIFGCKAGGYYDSETGDYVNVTFVGEEGTVFSVPVYVGANVPDGAYTVEFEQVLVGTTDDPLVSPQGVESSSKGSFTLTVGDGTGINSINADDVNAPVYNIAGQRVSKAQKGVFIQNGKKVAVK